MNKSTPQELVVKRRRDMPKLYRPYQDAPKSPSGRPGLDRSPENAKETL